MDGDDIVYSVSCFANESTYVFDVYRYDGLTLDTLTYTFEQVHDMYPGARNENDALSWLNANAQVLFSY